MYRTTIATLLASLALFLASPTMASAQTAQQYLQVAQQYENLAANYERQGQYTTAKRYRETAQAYRQMAQMFNAGKAGNSISYRVTLSERYLYRDRYGRQYWSNWQSAGHFENPSQANVQNYVRGWLEKDPYKTSSGQPVSRKASQIAGIQQ